MNDVTNEREQSASLQKAIDALLAAGNDNATYWSAFRDLKPYREQASEALVCILRDSKLPSGIRESTTPALNSLQGRNARRLLLDAAVQHPEEWVRAEAVRLLRWYSSKRLIAPLLALLHDQRNSPELRSEAAHTLGFGSTYGCSSAYVRALIPHLRDPAPEVRLTVIYAITQNWKGRHAVNEIRKLVNDNSPAPGWPWTVAQEARWSVVKLLSAHDDPGDPESPMYQTDEWKEVLRTRVMRKRIDRWKR